MKKYDLKTAKELASLISLGKEFQNLGGLDGKRKSLYTVVADFNLLLLLRILPLELLFISQRFRWQMFLWSSRHERSQASTRSGSLTTQP